MKKKYMVTIEERLVYEIEVEAENEKLAENEAYASEKFTNNISDDNDSEVTSVIEIIEEEE